MRRTRLLAGLIFAASLLPQCGCPAGARKHMYPEDPLFVSKKPLEAVPTPAAPVPAAHAEPQLPPVPATVRLATQK